MDAQHHENALRQLGVTDAHLAEFRARGIDAGQIGQWIGLLLPVILQILGSLGKQKGQTP